MFYHYRSLRLIGQMSANLEIAMLASRDVEVRWNHKILNNYQLKIFLFACIEVAFGRLGEETSNKVNRQTDGKFLTHM